MNKKTYEDVLKDMTLLDVIGTDEYIEFISKKLSINVIQHKLLSKKYEAINQQEQQILHVLNEFEERKVPFTTMSFVGEYMAAYTGISKLSEYTKNILIDLCSKWTHEYMVEYCEKEIQK